VALNYVNKAAFKASVSIQTSATDADIDMALHAAEQAVERVAGKRQFYPDTTSSDRYFDTTDPHKIYVDDITDVDTVEVDGGIVTGYVLGPVNAAVRDEPFTHLSCTSPIFTTIEPNGVKVTGTWGWPAIPSEVPQMVTILASRLLKRTREAPFGVVTAGSIEGIAVQLAKTDPEVGILMDPLIRHR
jgi:hypothetical protein